jgi:hypothetical protein
MESLINEAWRLYIQTSDPCVVRPSIPILYFGNLPQYADSALKVITVALNPSHHEFPVHDRFARFRPAESIANGVLDNSAQTAYRAALDGYFRDQPYMRWFGWFEHVLLGMGASYRGGEANTALHTDLCSPLATNPTWSRLNGQQDLLARDGMALWHRLVDRLAPDAIVISVRGQYRDQITFADRLGWQPLVTIQREDPAKRPYQAVMQRATLPGGTETLLVFGPAAQQPFATLIQEARQRVGRQVREVLDAPVSKRLLPLP